MQSKEDDKIKEKVPRRALIAKESTISGCSKIEYENQENTHDDKYKK